jgi:hypothetical protein
MNEVWFWLTKLLELFVWDVLSLFNLASISLIDYLSGANLLTDDAFEDELAPSDSAIWALLYLRFYDCDELIIS